MGKSNISWTEQVWNPLTGCSPVSAGCENCYAKRMAKRLRAAGVTGYENGFDITLHPDRLREPFSWRKPRRVFVCSMGDLFHVEVPGSYINRVWNVAFNHPKHIFFFLTKRPERMRAWTETAARAKAWPIEDVWPEWMWIGVSVENQERADERLSILNAIPAAHRFVSCEPLLGPLNLKPYLDGLSWVIAGGESGAGHRPMDLDWARKIRNDCFEAEVPFHFKQHSGPYPGYKPTLDGVAHKDTPIPGGI